MSYDATESLQIALREYLIEAGSEDSRARRLSEELDRELSAGEVRSERWQQWRDIRQNERPPLAVSGG